MSIPVRKSYATEAAVNTMAREITAYASVFGNVDEVGDVVAPGAFTKTLQERYPAGLIKVCWNHDEAIGRLVKAEQDSTGLLTVCKISKTEAGDEAMTLVADGVSRHFSFAGDIISSGPGRAADGSSVRVLKEIRLDEVGPVLWPANESARILSVKSRIRRISEEGFTRKSLSDLAYVMREAQCLHDALVMGPALTDDERALAEELVRLMSASSMTLSDVLAAAEPSATSPESADTPAVEVVPAMAEPALTNAAAESLGLMELMTALKARTTHLSRLARP